MLSRIASVLDLANSPAKYKIYHDLKRMEYQSLEENLKRQKKMLFALLKYAVENIPFYRNVEKSQNIKLVSEDEIFEQLRRFPVLNKKILREFFPDLKSEAFSGKFYQNTSGGSTGEPALFLQDLNYKNRSKGAFMLFYDFAGRQSGEKLIRLWSSHRDVVKGKFGLEGWLQKNLLNVCSLNAVRMHEKDKKRYVKQINQFRPKVIEAYAHAIYELAKYVLDNNIEVFSPQGIICTAGNRFDFMKEAVEKAFKCKTFNRYGSREAGTMACECEKQEGLHLNVFNHYIEILDQNMQPCQPGQVGKIYVTNLHNHVMPLIRYDINDMAVPAENIACSCGRGMPLIASVEGRTLNMFKMKNKGDVVCSGSFMPLFYYKEWVKKYQIVQKEYDLVLIRVVPGSKPVQEGERMQMEEGMRNLLGQGCRIKWEFVDDIPSSPSGKYLFTISEIE